MEVQNPIFSDGRQFKVWMYYVYTYVCMVECIVCMCKGQCLICKQIVLFVMLANGWVQGVHLTSHFVLINYLPITKSFEEDTFLDVNQHLSVRQTVFMLTIQADWNACDKHRKYVI